MEMGTVNKKGMVIKGMEITNFADAKKRMNHLAG
jgi:hypothetical protein